MRLVGSFLLLSFILFFSTVSLSKQADSALIPLEYFNHTPMVQAPKISPDGKHIAFIMNQAEFTQVAIVPFDKPQDVKVVMQLASNQNELENFYWINNQRLLVKVITRLKVLSSFYPVPALFSVSLDGKNIRELKSRKYANTFKNPSRLDDVSYYFSIPRLYHLLPNDKENILVTLSDERDSTGNHFFPQYQPSVFKVNINTGEFTKLLSNTDEIRQWIPDSRGVPTIGRSQHFDDLFIRGESMHDWLAIDKDDKKRALLAKYPDHRFNIIQFDETTHSLLVHSDFQHAGDTTIRRMRLWRYDLAIGEFVELLSDVAEPFDVTEVISRHKGPRKGVIGYKYNDGFEQVKFFDKDLERLSLQIKAAFKQKGLHANIEDWDEAGKRFLISTVSSTQPLTYYSFDQTSKSLKPWYSSYPNLTKQALADVERFEFKAQDGKLLEGFLTLPERVKKPPVVVLVHDGPYGKADTLEFNVLVQMMASRGFAVLQVNFRGSGFIGYDFEVASRQEWGKKMQTDLYDGLKWLEKSGKADTTKVCIMGQGYGGYAALTAGYQKSNDFKCIVSLGGITDFSKYKSQVRRLISRSSFARFYGGDESNNIESPLEQSKRFKAPVLLLHSKYDAKVTYHQSINLFDELEEYNKTVIYKQFDSLDYGHCHNTAWGEMMTIIERFLVENLK